LPGKKERKLFFLGYLSFKEYKTIGIV